MFRSNMVNTPQLQVEEESYEILYKCLKIGSLSVKADLLPGNYIGEDARPEGRPSVVVAQSGISFRIRLQKTNVSHYIRIPQEELDSIRVYNQENPGFMLIELSASHAEHICATLRMQRGFGPYLNPNAIEMEKKYIIAHCDSRMIPTRDFDPFKTYMDLFSRNSSYQSFFQTLKKSEVHLYIPTFFNKKVPVDDRDEIPARLADQVKRNQRIKKHLEKKNMIDGKGDRRGKTYGELLAEDMAAATLQERKSTRESQIPAVESSAPVTTNGTNGHHHFPRILTESAPTVIESAPIVIESAPTVIESAPIVIESSDSENDTKMEVDEAVTEPHEGKESDLASFMNLEGMDEERLPSIADDTSTLTANSPPSSRDSLAGDIELLADKGKDVDDEEPPSPKPETVPISPSTTGPPSPSTSASTDPSVVDPPDAKDESSSVAPLPPTTSEDAIKLQLQMSRKKVLAKKLKDEAVTKKFYENTKKTDDAAVASTSTEQTTASPPPTTTAKEEEEEKTPDVTEDQPSTSKPKRVKEKIIRKARKTNGKKPKSKYLMLPNERAKIMADESQESAHAYRQVRSDMITEMKLTPLCQCNITIFHGFTSTVICMALEMTYGRITGCGNPGKKDRVYRSQSDKPAIVLCEEHAERIFRHETCPGCGMFCVGGKCVVCIKCPDVPHRFHRECASARCNVETCLHCGATSDYHRDVDLVPGGDLEIEYLANGQDPEKLIKRHYNQQRIRTARIQGDNKLLQRLELGDLGADEEHKCSRPMPDGSVFDLSGLPPGPDRSQMLQIIKHMVPGKKTPHFYPSRFLNIVRESNVEEFMNMMINLNSRQKHFSTFNRALFVAYDARVKTILYVLFMFGCDPNVKNPSGQTLLYKAVKEANHEYIYWLLLQGADPKVRDDRCGEGMTPFHLAALQGDIRSIYLMLQSHKIDINMKDNDDWTPFCLAASVGDAKMAEYLLCMGADPSISSNTGYNGLHWAVKSQNADVVKLCLHKSMDVDKRCIKGGNTPLHLAALNNDYLTVTLLLARGANPNAKNNQSKDPIKKADPSSMVWLALNMNSNGRKFFNTKDVVLPLHFERVLCEDMSRGHAAVPVSCVNSVDSAGCPTCEPSEKQFRYVTDFIVVDENSQPSMVLSNLDTCNCRDTCGSTPGGKCSCCSPYGCYYDDNGHLLDSLDPSTMEPIYECTRMCACSKTCRNRVVQYGTRFRLQVYRTEYMGWGLRSLDFIPKGAFVIDYVGEIVSDELADQREEDTYLFDLLESKMAAVFCVDANKYGNCSRFINHLCKANLYTIRCYTDHRHISFPRLAFFAIKPIAPYEELGFDYGESFWDVMSKKNIFCKCYSPNCKYSAEHYAKMHREETEMEANNKEED